MKILFFTFLTIFANTIFAQNIDSIQTIAASAYSENDTIYPFDKVPNKPTIDGWFADDFDGWINYNIEYPEDAKKVGASGSVVSTFVISKTGEIVGAEIVRGVYPSIDQQIIDAINMSPRWKPGRDKNGNPINVRLYATTKILNNHMVNARMKEVTEHKTSSQKDVYPYETVVMKPKFNKGNLSEFTKWIDENIQFPKKETKRGEIDGIITVSFIINKAGKVCDIYLEEGMGKSIDRALIQAVSESPQWSPGQNSSGYDVNVSVNFTYDVTVDEDGKITHPTIASY